MAILDLGEMWVCHIGEWIKNLHSFVSGISVLSMHICSEAVVA